MKRAVLLSTVLSLATLVAAAQQSPAEAYEEQLHNASILLRTRKLDDAVKEYKRATKMKPDDAEAWFGLAQTYQQLAAYKDMLDAARRVFQLTTEKVMQSNGHNLAGVALSALGDDKRDQNKYQAAEQEFRAAIAAVPTSGSAHYNLGAVLLKQGRDVDGTEELKRCLECNVSPGMAKSAQGFIDNPRRARENFAPDFSFTTMQGEYVSLDDLQGKVVLLDFWASWCQPCRDSIGDLKFFVKKFSKDPVVVISISADRDEEPWRSFVTAKKMDWPQYWDPNGRVGHLFGVRGFPSYIILDGEGIIVKSYLGAGGFRAAEIEDAIKRTLKTLPKAKAAATSAGQ